MRLFMLLLLLPSCTAQAQSDAVKTDTVYIYAPLGSNSLAETGCLGGRILQVMDMEVIGTDIEAEIIVHENKHAEQILRHQLGGLTNIGDASISPKMICPSYGTGISLLAIEVEAFCASLPVRMQRGFTKAEVDEYYLKLLHNAYGFGPDVTPAMIDSMYRTWCG